MTSPVMSGRVTSDRLLVGFAAISLATVLLGTAVCAMSGVPSGLWIRNLAAWGFGALAATALARWADERLGRVIALAAPLCLGVTFLSPGLEGVHRWLVAGPLRVNAAMLLLPSLVVATAVLTRRHRWGWAPAFAAVALLALQPDASQASAMALAICAIAAVSRPRAEGWAAAIGALILAFVSWTRPDRLQPVPEVEEVLQLAGAHSPVLALLAVIGLTAFAAAPSLATLGRGRNLASQAGVALTALLSGWIVAPAVGAFPVPLVGVGFSPILGAWIGVGLLASLKRRACVSADQQPVCGG